MGIIRPCGGQPDPRRNHLPRSRHAAVFAPSRPTPRSAIPGCVWPAVPDARGAALLAVLQQIEHSQWWPPARLREWQLRQADGLLAHAFASVPVYRERLEAAGFAPGRGLDEDVWARIPLLGRTDIQQTGERLLSTAPPAEHGAGDEVSTSGSTGVPVTVHRSGLVALFWDVFTLRDHFWHRRDLTAKLAAIRSYPNDQAVYPDGVQAARWGRSTAALYETGPFVGLSVITGTAQQAEWLARHRPDYLLTYPSAALALARHCRDSGIDLSFLRELRTLSEPVTPELRRLASEVWGAEVTDAYSTQEAGYLALQCPDHDHYHVQSENVLLEVLRPDGSPCAPGEIGRVVLTTLHNFVMPLIRYDIGDFAEVGEPCPCGRGLPVLQRIVGRVRNMLTFPDGRTAWPLVGEMFYRGVAPIRQYQMIQKAPNRLELRIVPERPLTAEEEDELRAIVRRRMGHPFEIDFSYHDEIARGPGGKYEDFRSEIAPGAADVASPASAPGQED